MNKRESACGEVLQCEAQVRRQVVLTATDCCLFDLILCGYYLTVVEVHEVPSPLRDLEHDN